MDQGQAFICVLEWRRKRRRLEEIQERYPLAFRAGVDRGIVCSRDRLCHGAGWPKRCAQILAIQIFANSLAGGEKEEIVFDERAAETAAKLISAETVEWLSVRRRRSQCFVARGSKSSAPHRLDT